MDSTLRQRYQVADKLKKDKDDTSSAYAPPSASTYVKTHKSGWNWSTIMPRLFLLACLGLSPIFVWAFHRYTYNPELRRAVALGAIDHQSARIWVRALGASAFRVRYRTDAAGEGSNWSSTQWEPLSEVLEYTTTMVLSPLVSKQMYSFEVDLRSEDASASASASLLNGTFTTFPSLTDTTTPPPPFSMSFGSCMAVVPYFPLTLFDWIRDNLHPHVFLHLGDFIYSDFPFRIPFSQAYRQVMDDPAVSSFMRHVPLLASYDDHEIKNDWGSVAGENYTHALFEEAVKQYDLYSTIRNPVPRLSAESTTRFFNFSYSNLVDVFVLDTRGHRSLTFLPDSPSKSLMGSEQKHALKQWLSSSKAAFKLIASSVVWSANAHKRINDGWAGYLHERNEILDFVEEHDIEGVVLLSGDVHWAAVFQPRPWTYELEVSPLRTFPLPARDAGLEPTHLLHDKAFHLGHIKVEPATASSSPKLTYTLFYWRFFWENPSPLYTLTLTPEQLRPSTATKATRVK
eukprot:GILK01008787.1.p1 GENE.GILK01008787.1~~GILK01008787.1.p1  ORF type:complete len:514 (+),score=67.82 GILK01008787.1:28-1569(+)